MATEKPLLPVDLYDNSLTEVAGDYSGKISISGTLRNANIAERIVKERTEYRLETIYKTVKAPGRTNSLSC